jgi:O-antigen/teichoic acid export membrane protein
MKALVLEYSDFPLYAASQNVLNATSQSLPILLLGHFYGLAVAGAYALGVRVLHVPTNFVLIALRQVLFQRAAELHHGGKPLDPLFRKCTLALMLTAALPALVGFLWSPPLFGWVFGEQWFEAGRYARWLILWMAVGFCNVPAILFTRVLRCNRVLMCYEVVLLLARATMLVVGGLILTAGETIALFSIVGAILNGAIIVYVGHRVRSHDASVKSGVGADSVPRTDAREADSGAIPRALVPCAPRDPLA